MELPAHGSQQGCSDQGHPIDNTEYQLSRIYDMLYSAQEAGLSGNEIQKIFSTLPGSTKLEFNYSNWRYCNPGALLTYRTPNPRHHLLAACEPDGLNLLKI